MIPMIVISKRKMLYFQLCCDGSGTEDPFIWLVSGAPEPMTVLSFDWLLQDVDRFCGGEEHAILSVDPTFNLGDFDVTVTTYRHLMLINSHGSHPVMIGPMFIHQRKKFLTISLLHH